LWERYKDGGLLLFGIQASVLIVAVFTAFVGYQFRLREKKKDLSHSELLKSYNEAYSPILFMLKEIQGFPPGEERENLINKFFSEFGISGSRSHLIGSAQMLDVYFELNTLYIAYKHEEETYEEKFLECFKNFEILIDQEFWDAHYIIYKEHIRYKNHHFKPLKAIFIDLIGTLRFIFEVAMCIVVFLWCVIIYDYFMNLNAFPGSLLSYAKGITIMVCMAYGATLIYSFTFYKDTSNRRKRK
jgi:hypothetical protein